MDKDTGELVPGDVVEVRRSRARVPPTAPDGRRLRHRLHQMRPARGDKVTVQSVRAPLLVPNIPRYPDLQQAGNDSVVLQVNFTDGSVAYAPALRCAWYVDPTRTGEP